MTTKIISGLKITHELYRCRDGSQSLRFFAISKAGVKRRIGTIKLQKVIYGNLKTKIGKIHWETHSNLQQPYRRRGIGQWMYQRAIDIVTQRGDVISSSTCYSDQAERAWKSRQLNTKYDIRHNSSVSRFVVRKRK